METAGTRSAMLELREEQRIFTEGYRFLDEKRMLLVGEIMRELGRYRQVQAAWRGLFEAARQAMAAAVERHGLLDLAMAPAKPWDPLPMVCQERDFFGVRLLDATFTAPPPPVDPWPLPSPEVTVCRDLFTQLAGVSAQLAAITGNLQRLMQEYRRTERRARALEDVILPELAGQLSEIGTRLEEIDQEEAIRVRLGRHHV